MPEPRIVVVDDAVALGQSGAEYVCASLRAALSERGQAHLALTGGGTAIALYRALAGPRLRESLDWGKVQFWWGDDRFVPFDHPDSNVHLVEATLLASPEGLAVPAANLHPFPIPEADAASQGPDWCAQRYASELTEKVPLDERGLPVFDLVLLGVGPDGHFLSCFPGSPLVDAPAPPICAGVPAPTSAAPHVPRVTCSPRLTEVARDVLVMAAGAAKAPVIAAILAGPRDPRRYPAQLAARAGATWLLDAAAAADLPGALRSGGA
jgi:6-phosphogluconolactonase